jgi:curved DNA-binding protein CbpA
MRRGADGIPGSELHPDTGFHDGAASEQLKAINLAYQTLKDLKQDGLGRRSQPGVFHGVRAPSRTHKQDDDAAGRIGPNHLCDL